MAAGQCVRDEVGSEEARATEHEQPQRVPGRELSEGLGSGADAKAGRGRGGGAETDEVAAGRHHGGLHSGETLGPSTEESLIITLQNTAGVLLYSAAPG